MANKDFEINKFPKVIKELISIDRLKAVYRSISHIVLDRDIDEYNLLVEGLHNFALNNYTDYIKKMRAASRSVLVKNILSNTELVDIASSFGIRNPVQFSSPVLHVSSRTLIKGSEGVDIHQDWPSALGSFNSIIIWISLGGVDAHSGGLYFYQPKSQVELLAGSVDQHVVKIEEESLRNYDKKYYYVHDGGALVFGHFIPHSSLCDKTRMSISIRIEDSDDLDWFDRGYEYAQNIVINRKQFSISDLGVINAKINKI